MRALIAALALALALLLPASSAFAQTKVVLGYGPASTWIPAFVAKEEGIFAKHGLDVTLQFIPTGTMQAPALASNSIQIASLTASVLLLGDEGGLDMQAVAGAAVQTKQNPFGAVMARTGSGIEKPADFPGKTIGVPGLNGVLHIAFMKWLKMKGVDPASIKFSEVSMPMFGGLMKSGQIDGAVLVEPFLGQIEHNGTGIVISEFPKDLANPSYIDAFYGMRRSYIEANPKVLEAFRASIKEATAWVATHEEAARRTQVKYLHLPEKLAMIVKLPTLTAEIKPAEMQFWIDICKELGITNGSATLETVMAK
jgi:NitT/TauT family transport system substrate-binding protein